jgi:hypothetical protein
MKYRYIALDRNPKRVWPIQLPTGEVVMVPSSHWIETEHDLSDWVSNGMIAGGPVAEGSAPIAQPIAQKQEVVDPPKDRMAAFAEALGNAFAKSAPQPAVEPVVVPAAKPVEPVVEPSPEPVAAPVDAASDAVEELVEAAAEAAENDLSSMTRKQLWAEVVSRGLNVGLIYNNTTKAEMVRLLSEAAEG